MLSRLQDNLRLERPVECDCFALLEKCWAQSPRARYVWAASGRKRAVLAAALHWAHRCASLLPAPRPFAQSLVGGPRKRAD